ncbi:N-acetyl-gamma-glutamyl-phosphate reductase [Fulvivirga imtechensis AK7]|uniref:N-acetyl-gamma-glutamyl-phosphate reductase n=1 Tax=Fulvivirga imtechensis AK7 TaxID=1237149 RepID=L8JQG7_9BACT|nr:N-acetyl-gamma-glutamyl-phosphate reductase [Fulvivirga imtechensis]ELR69617.1 N-acetyl-gamma-glutamyl-phosphate reductase [Fulvivirga imtechensis AK7]
MIKAGIIGGAGYTAGELLRILVHHPEVNVAFVQSSSQSGKPVSTIHDDLIAETDLVFQKEQGEADVIFLCQGHGKARTFLLENTVSENTKIIDLSQDFRHQANATLDNRQFIYGLPELNKNKIQSAENIANPGCFATAIQLALLPLAQSGLLTDEVHVHAVTGSTGAGQAPGETTHFSWRNDNVSVYKAFEHQHLKEITESITTLQKGFDQEINFIPMRGNFSRGIFVSAYTTFEGDIERAYELFGDFYSGAAFTKVTKTPLHLKQVVNTNYCFLHLAKHGSKLLITSAIDNLLKGASGQAVQNLNLMFGLKENLGLQLKANAF